jgi:quercetin dioxygenase-like cupin family protein
MGAARVQARSTVQEDNERVKVTEWRFERSAETGWHRHELDYVIVPMTSGTLLLETSSGTQTSQLTAGGSYFRRAGVEHNVVNGGDQEFVFLEIELKQQSLGNRS